MSKAEFFWRSALRENPWRAFGNFRAETETDQFCISLLSGFSPFDATLRLSSLERRAEIL